MNGLKRIGIDYNQGDKWSDEESDDECVSSELKTDTGKRIFRKINRNKRENLAEIFH